jgi:hypothetical protein
LRRVDDESTSKRHPADQHAKTHLVAACERQLDRNAATGDDHGRADDRSPLEGAVARPDVAPSHEGGLGSHGQRHVPLMGMEHEAHHRPGVGSVDDLDRPGVQRRRPCAGVDLGLDGVDTQFGQRHPFPPADGRRHHGQGRYPPKATASGDAGRGRVSTAGLGE